MDADTEMPAGQAGGPPPIEVLQAGFTPEMFHAMRSIFHGFEQRFRAVESNMITSQSFQNAIATGFTNTHLTITAPTTVPPLSSASRANPPRTTVQPFSGRANENVTAWISLVEDTFDAGQVPKDQWTRYAAQYFREAALSWYHGQKKGNQDRAPYWDDLKLAMMDHWAHPAKADELRARLDRLTCQGGVTEYTWRFQEIEIQIPPTEMALPDHKYQFTLRLPEELSMQIMARQEKSMAPYYTAVRQWDSLHKIAQGRPNSHLAPSKSFKRVRGLPSPSVHFNSNVTPYTPSGTSTSSHPEPMDLDAMMQSRDPRKPPASARCYNCNELGHLARDCRKPLRRSTSGSEGRVTNGRTRQSKPLHLFEEVEEELEQGEYTAEEDVAEEHTPCKYTPEEYDPENDLELQYLVNEANLMEQGELTAEEENELADITHAKCDCDACEDWSTKWRPISPVFPEEPGNDLTPADLALKNKGTKERPLEVFTVAHPGLPVYEMKIGPPKSMQSADAPIFISVSTILDTGAESNYLTAQKAVDVGAQVFPITAREIIGAGQTTTTAFASFSLKVRGLVSQCYAYVLEDTSQFRYDLLLGRAWLKRHEATPKWDNDAYELKHPEGGTPLLLEPVFTKEKKGVPKLLLKLAWRLRPRHQRPRRPELLYTHQAETVGNDKSVWIDGDSNTSLNNNQEPFGEHVKRIVKDALPDAFKDKVGFPPLRKWVHDIDIGDAKPLRKYGRPLTPLEHEAIKAFIENGLEEGVIEPSESLWSSPLIPVPKKDGTSRICVDYRALNKLTKPNAYPLPRIDECYHNLAGAKHFTCLDLRSGYWQVRLADDAKEKTAFTCRYGHFQFRVMPFGLTNAPATFQRMMNEILRGFIDRCAMVYLDDVIIFSRTEEEHTKNVLDVVRALQMHGLILNEKKCEWGRPSILYLGHIASGDGLRPNPQKVEAILKWPSCSTISEVRRFLNIAGYYRRFIRGFAKMASPLYKLLEGSPRKGSPIFWTEDCESAMKHLKDALTSADLLIHPTPWRLFVIDTDASGDCLGAVLQQTGSAFADSMEGMGAGEPKERFKFKERDLRPIAFESRRMTPTEQRYSAQEREMLAIVYALQKWRGYVEGSPILIRTDHESLKYFLTQKNLG